MRDTGPEGPGSGYKRPLMLMTKQPDLGGRERPCARRGWPPRAEPYRDKPVLQSDSKLAERSREGCPPDRRAHPRRSSGVAQAAAAWYGGAEERTWRGSTAAFGRRTSRQGWTG